MCAGAKRKSHPFAVASQITSQIRTQITSRFTSQLPLTEPTEIQGANQKQAAADDKIEEEEGDPRVGGRWRKAATLGSRRNCSSEIEDSRQPQDRGLHPSADACDEFDPMAEIGPSQPLPVAPSTAKQTRSKRKRPSPKGN
jgi:hypothetical protein